jgi:hypothetical protein
MVAIAGGHFQVVQYLVTQGADVDAKAEVCRCIYEYLGIILLFFIPLSKYLLGAFMIMYEFIYVAIQYQ